MLDDRIKVGQVSTVDRFLGASGGPVKPCHTITSATTSSTICVAVRSRRHLSSGPTIGQRRMSVSVGVETTCIRDHPDGPTLATSMRRSTRAPSASVAETSSAQSPLIVKANDNS